MYDMYLSIIGIVEFVGAGRNKEKRARNLGI